MRRSGIKEYLSEIDIRKVMELDTALIEVYGQKEGEWHIKRLMELFEKSEKQLLYGAEIRYISVVRRKWLQNRMF